MWDEDSCRPCAGKFKYAGLVAALTIASPAYSAVTAIDPFTEDYGTAGSAALQDCSVTNGGVSLLQSVGSGAFTSVYGQNRVLTFTHGTTAGAPSQCTKSFIDGGNPTKRWYISTESNGLTPYSSLVYSGATSANAFALTPLSLGTTASDYFEVTFALSDLGVDLLLDVYSGAGACSRALIAADPVAPGVGPVQRHQTDFTLACTDSTGAAIGGPANFSAITEIQLVAIGKTTGQLLPGQALDFNITGLYLHTPDAPPPPPPPPPPSIIPTLGEWGTMIMAGFMAIMGGFSLRRRLGG